MTEKAWYRAAAFDPSRGPVPEALGELVGRPPAEVPLVAVFQADDIDPAWATGAAAAIARAFSDAGREVALLELRPDAPTPGGAAATTEGVVDALLFGTSLDSLSVGVAGEGFAYVGYGAEWVDPAELSDSEAWGAVVRRAASRGRTLVVAAPVSAADAGLGAHASAAVLLGDPEAHPETLDLIPSSVDVAAVLRPVAEAAKPARAAVAADGEEGRGGAVRLALFIIVLALLAWLAWTQYGARLGLRDGSSEATPQAADSVAGGAAPAGEAAAADGAAEAAAEEIPLPYSVAVESQPDVETAIRRASVLANRVKDVTFFVAPITLDSVVYFRVLAGPSRDSAAAAALMGRLVSAGAKSGADDWSVRPTPWAFSFGDFPTEAAARARQEGLLREFIPTYVVEAGSGPSPVYRVYAGAFEGPGLADVMARMLKDAGVTADLVRRTGRAAE